MVVPPPFRTASRMIDEKAQLRRLVRFRRREFVDHAGATTCSLHALAIGHILFEKLRGTSAVAVYLSNGREVSPQPLAELAWAAGVPVALPAFADRTSPMRFARWCPDDRLVAGPYGVPQPLAAAPSLDPDVIVTPLVAFDRSGARLGQGGGHYDRAFALYPDARRIGLAWSVQEIAHVPVESWDKPLHAVATEKEWIDCA